MRLRFLRESRFSFRPLALFIFQNVWISRYAKMGGSQASNKQQQASKHIAARACGQARTSWDTALLQNTHPGEVGDLSNALALPARVPLFLVAWGTFCVSECRDSAILRIASKQEQSKSISQNREDRKQARAKQKHIAESRQYVAQNVDG